MIDRGKIMFFDISKLPGKLRDIADSIDKGQSGNKSNFIDTIKEKSLFEIAAQDAYNKGEITSTEYNSIFKVNHNDGLKYPEYIAPQDKTRVARVEPILMESVNPSELVKKEICTKLCTKWKKVFKNSPLQQSFFEKLYDVIDQLNVKVPEEKWDKSKYSSPKEQAMDEVMAIFACEGRLNPKTVSSSKPPYYGLFQLADLKTVNQYAASHPDEPGMKKIIANSKTMTMSKYKNLTGEEQLDYLIAYVGASREGSKMDPDAEITPAKLWSMIKLPNLPENNPKSKARRERTIVQKENAIDSVFRANKVPRGINK